MHIDKVVLHTNDLAAVRSFYNEVLGFAILEESATHISFSIGRSVLSFVEKPGQAFYHVAFLIPSNQLEQAFQFVRSQTSVLPFSKQSVIADFKNWNAQAFYFHDYSQNILEFITHRDLQNNSDTPFSAASVSGICELGIPVPSVRETCRFLNEKYQLPYYIKGPRMEDFAVMGDEDGLLIVTTTGRGWLPTQRPAEPHPFQLQLTHKGTTIALDETYLPK